MLKQFFILFTIASICVSCDKTYETIYQCAAVPEKTERGEDTLMKDSSGNFYFSRGGNFRREGRRAMLDRRGRRRARH